MYKNQSLIPTVKGFGRNKKIYVWCPFCSKEHTHPEEGYYIPMCSNLDSPFKKTGYTVKKYKITIE